MVLGGEGVRLWGLGTIVGSGEGSMDPCCLRGPCTLRPFLSPGTPPGQTFPKGLATTHPCQCAPILPQMSTSHLESYFSLFLLGGILSPSIVPVAIHGGVPSAKHSPHRALPQYWPW